MQRLNWVRHCSCGRSVSCWVAGSCLHARHKPCASAMTMPCTGGFDLCTSVCVGLGGKDIHSVQHRVHVLVCLQTIQLFTQCLVHDCLLLTTTNPNNTQQHSALVREMVGLSFFVQFVLQNSTTRPLKSRTQKSHTQQP